MGALNWDIEAKAALKRVPVMVRPLARRKIEQAVAASGGRQVRLADYEQAEARFKAVRGGRSDAQMAAMMPSENVAGASMVVIESCRHELAQCPNALIDTSEWRMAIEDWVQASGLSERLRARVTGDKLLYHHKLRIAIAGCPNGCSRPQIADLAIVGGVRPAFDAQACTACGECVAVCPDQAITMNDTAQADPNLCQGCHACLTACEFEAVSLSEPFVRVLMGGKLGRHPHLARCVAEVSTPTQLIDLYQSAVDRYLQKSPAGMRFAAWWTSQEEGGR